ncbi:hypothetical protein VU12_03950 [Desulfobulbus sp. US4]|nr:hypothetical protein [Desulfobulbus sp. US4]
MLTYKKYTTNTARAGTVFSKAGCIAANLFVGIAIVLAGVVLRPHSAFAADISVTPITWDIIGLDSNDVSTGPNKFPVGARICNNTSGPLANVAATFNWADSDGKFSDTTSPLPHSSINLRAGTKDVLTFDTVLAGECVDAYYEAEVVRNAASFDTTRNYSISVTSDTVSGSSSERQLYVEHLVSQNRNATTEVWYGTDPDPDTGDLVSVDPGGTLSMMVGGTYYIKLVGSTATQGYEQLESFINIPNTIFRIIEVKTSYTANTSGTVGTPNDKLYGDGCLWENNLASENLRSCLSTGKVGGGTEVLYKVEILSMPGPPLINPEPIQTLYYDFSGSSFHYNADWSASTRYIEIINASIVKTFDPKVIAPGGSSKLTFTITNPGPDELTDVHFNDTTGWPAGLQVTSGGTVGYSADCGSPVSDPVSVADATFLNFSNITIPAFGVCTITVTSVTVSSDGTYLNTTDSLFINDTTDTESYGEDTLVVRSGPTPLASCANPEPLAIWDFESETASTDYNIGSFAASSLPGTGVTLGSARPILSGATSGIVQGTTYPDGTTDPDWGKSLEPASDNATKVWGINAAAKVGWPGSYFEFQVDGAANYGGYSFSSSYNLQGNWSNSESWYVEFSTDGVNWTSVTSSPWDNADAWQTVTAGTGIAASTTSSAVSTVYFRVYVLGDQTNSAATLYLDDVTISGCAPIEFPTLKKEFLPAQICQGTISTLQFSIANPNTVASGVALNDLAFTDTLPVGLSVATQTLSACGGTDNVDIDAATRKITVTGGTLAPTASCTIDVEVTGAVAGTHMNTSGSISSAETGTSTAGAQIGYGQASIIVDPLPTTPTMNAEFSKTLLITGESTTLTFTIENPSASASSGINFSDTLPAGLSATNVDVDDVCGTGSNLSVTGGNSIALTGGNLAASGTCSFSVDITALSSGSYAYSVPIGSDATCASSDDAFIAVLVQNPTSDINLLKQISTSPTGPWSNYVAVPKETAVYYRFIVENTGNQALTQVSVSDDLMTINCQWKDGDGTDLTEPFILEVAEAADNGHFAVCEGAGPMDSGTSVTGVINTATATDPPTGESSTDTATYEVAELVLDKHVKSINDDETAIIFDTVGDVITYEYVITNNGANLDYPITIDDDKIGSPITCEETNESGGVASSGIFETNASNTCTADYTVTTEDMNVGSVTNIASASAVLTTGGTVTSNTDWEFVGTIIPTYAVVSSFQAYVDSNHKVVLEWTTASEIGTIGFILERLNEQSGKYQAVTKQMLPGMLTPPHGGTYRYVDKKAEIGRSYTYRVVEVAVNNQGVTAGPYTVQAQQPLPVNKQMFADDNGPKGYTLAHKAFSKKQLNRFAARDKAARKLAAKKKEKTGETIKIPVNKNGLVYLSADELATISGLSKKQVKRYLKRRCLVTLAGEPIPVITADSGSGMWFYGQGPKRKDIGQSVYLLELGEKGVKMENTSGRAKESAESEQSFSAHVLLEENLYSLYFYNISEPLDDFWVGQYLPAYGADAELSYTLDLPYLTNEGNATITFNLVGAAASYSGHDSPYKVSVLLNGNNIGTTVEWSERGDYQFKAEVAAELFQESDNEVRIVSYLNSGVKYSLIFVDSIEVEYQRRYEAVDGEVFLTNEEDERVTVAGFTGAAVLAMDVTEPNAARRVRVLTEKNQFGEYSATILTEPGHEYFLTEKIGEGVAGDISVDSPSQLRSDDNRADYLIITSLNLIDSAQRLADYRASEGMTTMVVDIEDIQDEFAHSLAAPEAVGGFLAYVHEYWTQVPRYVALIGDGSWDYNNYLGFGRPQVPAVLVSTPDGFFPSDNVLADVIGDDGVPEFAVGRIPVVDSRELDAYINKVIAYEQSLQEGGREMTLVTDLSDPQAGNFQASTDQVVALMPEYFQVNRLDADTIGYNGVQAGISDTLNQGAEILHYTGHSSWRGYGKNSSLMSSEGIVSMKNLSSAMLMVSMSCSSGSFGYPFLDSVGESAVLHATGGAVAFFGASGLSRNDLANIMAQGFYQSLFDPEVSTVGDAIVRGKQHYFEQGAKRYSLDIYNLLGDPAAHAPNHQ